MASKFTFTKENINKVKLFLDYVKKLETISAMENKQVFVINGNKLYIYAIGEAGSAGAGHVETVIDIKDVILDKNISTHFVMESSVFINSLEKVKSDDIFISLEKDKIKITGTGKSSFSSVLFAYKTDDELKEIQDHISTILKLPEFKTPININIADYKNEIGELAQLSKLLDVGRQVEISPDIYDNKKNLTSHAKVTIADNLCIFSWEPTAQIIDKETVYIDRDVTTFFKNVDNFQISFNKKFYYFDIANYGIKLMFVPKTAKWQFPTEQDVLDISPEKTKLIELEINATEFYDVLDEFEGMFESGSWRYKQVKVETPAGFKNELKIHYDNMVNEVNTILPVKILNRTDNTDNFEFLMPTLHFKHLKPFLLQDSSSTFKFTYSSVAQDQPHGTGLIISNGSVTAIIAKMNE